MKTAFILAYAGSGAAALIYQLVWMRLLSLQLGHTVGAVGTVLGAFMGGLAVGALIAGRGAVRLEPRQALRAYAATEGLIAVSALAFPVILGAFDPFLRWAYGDAPGWEFALARVVCSFSLVVAPAALMGATFPLAIRGVLRDSAQAGRRAARLYAINTAGATVGAVATGFVLLPALGLRGTTLVGIVLNLAAAAVAWILSAREHAEAPLRDRAVSPAAKTTRPRRREPRERRDGAAPDRAPTPYWLLAVVLAASGFASLLLEVVFTRVLAIALGPTSYAFAAMLTAFVGGIALGAMMAATIPWTRRGAAVALGLAMLLAAAAAAFAGWFAGAKLPMLMATAVSGPSTAARDMIVRQAVYAVAVLLPVSLSFGALFPIAAVLVGSSDGSIAREMSLMYGINTVGAVAGSLCAAFVLIPWYGLQQTLQLTSAFAVGVAALTFLALQAPGMVRAAGLGVAAVTGLAIFTVPAWDANLLSSGGYKYAAEVRDLNLDLTIGLRAGRLLYYKEGAVATVSVRQLAGQMALAIDGKVDASNGPDMLTQKLLGHLPLLLHERPEDICVIGLGSGVTLAAALRHGVTHADVIEISPEVVEASRLFRADNDGALEDQRTRLLVTDGRSHLRLGSRKYDVIISEPSNPWMAGVSSLFTREFFLAARERLAPGGVICQWAHTYDIDPDDLRSIAATFASVFPNGTVWLVGDGDVLFIASNDERGPRLENILSGWTRPGVAADLGEVAVADTFSLLSLYLSGQAGLQRYSDGAVIQTDDRMRLEFTGPLALYAQLGPQNVAALHTLAERRHLPPPLQELIDRSGAVEWKHRAQMLLKAHAYGAAFDDFARSVRQNPEDEQALAGWMDAARGANRIDEVRQALETLVRARPRSVPVRVALARLLAASGVFDQAVAQAEEVVAMEPDGARGLELLASIVADAGSADRLGPLVGRLQQQHPGRPETWYYSAVLSFLNDQLPQAIGFAERAVAMNPSHVLAHNLIGSAHARMGNRDRAREAFRTSLERNPQESSTYTNLGLLELEGGNLDLASSYFAEALTLDPSDELARENLSVATETKRRLEQAG
jgi:spermidine synthase